MSDQLTIDWVQTQVEAIRALAHVHDDKAAHAAEDALHQAVLDYISVEAPEPWASLAREALTDIRFCRRYV